MKKIAAIILGAGAASRFGSPKQLLRIDGEILLDRISRQAAACGCSPVIRVLGAHAQEIQNQSSVDDCVTVINPLWQSGMGTSIAAGISEIQRSHPDCDAAFILLVDQPMVDAAMLKSMIAAAEQSGSSIVLADNGTSTGPPALFKREHFPALAELTGDRGAKSIASKYAAEISLVAMPAAAWDIDSPAVWEALQRQEKF